MIHYINRFAVGAYKMKTFRVPLWVMVIALSVAVLGIAEATPRQVANHRLHKLKHRPAKNFRLKHKRHAQQVAAGKKGGGLESDSPKPLDLAVPFRSLDAQLSKEPGKLTTESTDSSLFAGSYARQNSVQVKGQVVMLQEPEADKRKSVDGAGIMIDFRR